MKARDEDIKTKAIEIFDQTLKIYGDDSLSVMFSQTAQLRRFISLVKNIDLTERDLTILDVGCGNGALFEFLQTCGFHGTYTGYDINHGLLEQARRKYSSERVSFENFDILQSKVEKNFDYVFMSGLFNSDYGQSFDWVCRFVKAMFHLSRRATIFNAISIHVNRRDEGMYYINPSELLDYILCNLTPAVAIFHDAPIFNFQVELRPTGRVD